VLTKTERNVLSLVAQGRSNAEIAESLSIRVATVKWHLKNAFAKLPVHWRTAAIAQARRQGIVI
jgi:LuxR family transcriptional regulator, maltose regulon positive regulatory protein